MWPRTKFTASNEHTDIGTGCTGRCPGGSLSAAVFPCRLILCPEGSTDFSTPRHPRRAHPHSLSSSLGLFNGKLRPCCRHTSFDVISSLSKGCKHSLKMRVYMKYNPRHRRRAGSLAHFGASTFLCNAFSPGCAQLSLIPAAEVGTRTAQGSVSQGFCLVAKMQHAPGC